MILKGLREKSNQKHINKLLSSRNNIISDSKIESIGVILSHSEFNDFEAFRNFGKELNLHPNKIKIILFTEEEITSGGFGEFMFNKKQFGWKCKIKDAELQQFIETDFDALFCYYNEEIIELNMVTSLSKANFKIGLSGPDERQFDFIINVNTKDFDVFTEEIKKYLSILNKIKE